MRQIATIPPAESRQARLFVDYLASLSIDAKLTEADQGLELWICDEDHVARAREEHEAFRKNPSADRYRRGSHEARQKRTAQARANEQLRRREENLHKRMHDVPQRQWTVALVAASVVITLAMFESETSPWVHRNLFISAHRQADTFGEAFAEVKEGEIWRLVTPMFLHFDALHIIFNMLWLVNFGTQVEKRAKVLAAFCGVVLVIAVVSNVSQYVLSGVELTSDWGIRVHQYRSGFGGMSGVVFGLFGYVWMKSRYQPSLRYFMAPVTVFLMIAWLYLCMTGLVGHIANTAHVMGLVVGLLLGYGTARLQGIEQPFKSEGT